MLEDVDGLLSATHVRALSNDLAASSNESLSLLLGHFVLGGGGQGNVNLVNESPRAFTLVVLEALSNVAGLDEVGEVLALELDVSDGGDVVDGEALGILSDQGTLGVGEGKNVATEFNDLEGGVLGDVAGAGDEDALAVVVGGSRELGKHVADVVDETVASGLGADVGTTA